MLLTFYQPSEVFAASKLTFFSEGPFLLSINKRDIPINKNIIEEWFIERNEPGCYVLGIARLSFSSNCCSSCLALDVLSFCKASSNLLHLLHKHIKSIRNRLNKCFEHSKKIILLFIDIKQQLI